jgi:hypothetical protein
VAAPVLILALVACGREIDTDALLDPETCRGCHPDHVARWEGSMHAHAVDDPVFLAMNARGQREASLGEFCVRCHAPVAQRLGLTDGTDVDELPSHLRGVTCAFCHGIDALEGTHDAAIGWTWDGVLRGGIPDPAPSAAHDSAYSPLHDRDDNDSARTCGACHDVVLPNGFHLERTLVEWQDTVFGLDGPSRQSCNHCHLPGETGSVASVPGAPVRRVHDHAMPAVDVALVPFPGREAQRALVQAELDRVLLARLCIVPAAGGAEIVLTLENVQAGHDFPSGAGHDRRVWVELLAREGDTVLLATEPVPDGTPLADVPDPARWELHDVATTADGRPAHLFWEVEALEERALTGPLASGRPHGRERRWSVLGAVPDRVETRVRLRPIGLDVLDALVASGDLDAGVRAAMPTFTLGSTELVWTTGDGDCAP